MIHLCTYFCQNRTKCCKFITKKYFFCFQVCSFPLFYDNILTANFDPFFWCYLSRNKLMRTKSENQKAWNSFIFNFKQRKTIIDRSAYANFNYCDLIRHFYTAKFVRKIKKHKKWILKSYTKTLKVINPITTYCFDLKFY